MSHGYRLPLIQKKETPTKTKKVLTKETILYRLNALAALLHFASFIGALVMSILYAGQSYMAELRTDFFIGNVTSDNSLGRYPVLWVDLPFPIITAIFHAVIAFHPAVNTYYTKSVLSGVGNPLRWIEYSITASLMVWVLMQLSGVTNVFLLLVGGVIVNIALQWQGHLQEKLKNTSYVPTAVGWLLFVGQWTIVFSYFFAAVSSVEGVPWFVYTIVIGLFFMFASFGFVQLAYITGFPKFMASPYAQEIAFLVLSFTAKFFLTWNLLIGAATSNR